MSAVTRNYLYWTHAATTGCFSKYFEPFALAGLSLTGTGVGLSRFSDGER